MKYPATYVGSQYIINSIYIRAKTCLNPVGHHDDSPTAADVIIVLPRRPARVGIAAVSAPVTVYAGSGATSSW